MAALLCALCIAGGTAHAQQSLADVNSNSSATSSADSSGVSSSTQALLDQTTAQISALKQEIAELQNNLNNASKQKQSLQGAISALNLNIQKITASIALTNAQIQQKDYEIETLSGSISTTTSAMTQTQAAVADSLRQVQQADSEPLAMLLLAGGTLSSALDQTVALDTVRSDLQNYTQELSQLKTSLVESKTVTQQKRSQLAALEVNLTEQKQGLAIARTSQTQLLAQTKNQEANYQALIAQKEAQEAQFEQQLLNAASQLNLTVNPLSIPPQGPVLAWPVDNTAITQYFGNTAFATQNPQIYNGHGHDGVDLRASPGTPVHAALTGVVMGTGNTDATCPNASFGKWVFIRHADGLSTMYAHLSPYS